MQRIIRQCFLVVLVFGVSLELTPKLIVFDLDDTLLPLDLDFVYPPFTKDSNGSVHDYKGRLIEYFPDVPCILNTLQKEGYLLGIASRTKVPDEAEIVMKMFGWQNYFQYKEMYPGFKITQFKRIRDRSGIDFRDMMLFDDDMRNIETISRLGVKCIFVKADLTIELIKNGLKKYNPNLTFDC